MDFIPFRHYEKGRYKVLGVRIRSLEEMHMKFRRTFDSIDVADLEGYIGLLKYGQCIKVIAEWEDSDEVSVFVLAESPWRDRSHILVATCCDCDKIEARFAGTCGSPCFNMVFELMVDGE